MLVRWKWKKREEYKYKTGKNEKWKVIESLQSESKREVAK